MRLGVGGRKIKQQQQQQHRYTRGTALQQWQTSNTMHNCSLSGETLTLLLEGSHDPADCPSEKSCIKMEKCTEHWWNDDRRRHKY
jgi:hypothetical protein